MAREMHDGVSDQSKAGRHRRIDAQVLFDGSRWRAAMYLGGYNVECLLKSKLMTMFGCDTIRELEEELKSRGVIKNEAKMYTHEFESLLRASQAFDRLRNDSKTWSLFLIVNRWIPAWRYDPNPSNPEAAKSFLDALDQIARWIEFNI